MPRKVIGFDSWTGGAHNFERLLAAFSARQIDLSLVHIGSWGGDPDRPDEERVGELLVRDISFYGGNGLSRILEAEKPDAVLFLSTDTFAHRAFNRHCQKMNIPTLHLYHGLVSVQETGAGQSYKINPLAQIRFVAARVPKALRYIWPAYAKSMLSSHAPIKDWLRFGQDIILGAMGKFNRESADDARTDRCCVYVDADTDHAIKKYGFMKEHVIPVGNPDLARFGLSPGLIGSMMAASGDDRSGVMYVDTGLIYTGFVFQSPAEFIRHLVATKEQLARNGKKLLFKPHPDHQRTDVPAALAAAGIEICSNADLVPRLKQCCACIVEPSTMALVPALMGLPLFLAQYGKLAEQRFGKVLTSYPRAYPLSKLTEFGSLLSTAEMNCDTEATQTWINRNAGPLPATEMPSRVIDVIEKMIAGRRLQTGLDGRHATADGCDASS